jgi:hypothetical protein
MMGLHGQPRPRHGRPRRRSLRPRRRPGGRILTLRDPEWPLPVELGPEFLHGEAKATREVAQAAGLAVVEISDEHAWAERGRLRPMGEVWTRFGELLSRIPARGADLSFERFLSRRRVGEPLRSMACLFVVTLPLGVLKASPSETGAVAFDPMPPALRSAVRMLEVSHACKLVLRFREALWDRIDFLHDRHGDFPTWWTASPRRAPVTDLAEMGTVAGAIASGQRAARQAASALGRRP